MIRALRKKLIVSAMAAFGILMLILISSVVAVSHIRIENQTDALMRQLLASDFSAENPAYEDNAELHKPPNAEQIAYYDITIAADGSIRKISEKGIWAPDYDAAQTYALRLFSLNKSEGKFAGFKYRLQHTDNNETRVILMDTSSYIHMLKDMLQTALIISLSCLLLLFLILLPISSRTARSYAQHIEKQKQFITNAGHDIKTPVAIILSNLDAMELIQGENKWSRNIRSQSDRLNLLLQRLLFMARLDESSVLSSVETLEISSILSAELETYEPIISERKLSVTTKLSDALFLKGSRLYIQQLIHMLLDNAVQYADSGGEISVSSEAKRRKIRLIFSNTVENVPNCPPEALFDRFYRANSARTQTDGCCGIGLSAARAIAEMHRGTIFAEYDGKTRIRFIVDLPQE